MKKPKKETVAQAMLGAYTIKEEEKYLHDIADKFSADPGANYRNARSIAIDAHLFLELYMNIILAICTYLGAAGLGLPAKLSDLVETIRESKIGYAAKAEMMDKLGVFSKKAIKILVSVNKIRNAFAHGYESQSPRFKHFSHFIFEKVTVKKFINDFEKVKEEFGRVLISYDSL
ncbi:MAG: hypothetical protein ABH885_05160 [Candidatus Omnitrophota bacterium]